MDFFNLLIRISLIYGVRIFTHGIMFESYISAIYSVDLCPEHRNRNDRKDLAY